MKVLSEGRPEVEHLSRLSGVHLQRGVSSSRATTFALGGPIDLLIDVFSLRALAEVTSCLVERVLPWQLLGAGSNVLLPDEGVEKPVIRLSGELATYYFSGPEVSDLEGGLGRKEFQEDFDELPKPGENVHVLAFAGAPLMVLSRRMSKLGLSGLEFASGIPGSVGGAVRMNAGAHGGCMGDVVNCVFTLGADLGLCRVLQQEAGFAYRRSELGVRGIIAAALLNLRRDEVSSVKQRCHSILRERQRTQPLRYPSAGSVFKNPSSEQCKGVLCLEGGVSAGKLLELVGLKGFRHGGVCFSEMHANWLIKVADDARASDAKWLIAEARRRVSESYGVDLELEVDVW